ncbi:AI-2E family transporter [soil metagenome]
MTSPSPPSSPILANRAFLLLVALVSVAFLFVLAPFSGAIFWGAIIALLFRPLFLWMLPRLRARRTWAALATLALVLLLVILPVALIVALLIQEASATYQRVQSGEFNLASYFQQVYNLLPDWARGVLDRAGLSNFALLQQKITAAMGRGSQMIATQVLSIGQSTFDFVVSFFVMLYLVFFLIRDGAALSARIMQAVPLDADIKAELLAKFLTVVRATVKGNVLVAMLQGALGGLIFWFLDVHSPVLWGTLMAFLSLLPALGAALVWIPVALYFLATGAIIKAVILTAAGVLVIGLVDNLLRPVLVGKDTQMPDYLVLISTLGGMALFGLNGFVIGPVVAAMFIAVWELFTEARLPGATAPDTIARERSA